jgi:ABC-2 type transport system ATP-binding protein
MPGKDGPIVELRDVTKEYRRGVLGRTPIEPGECLALLGPNRAGKTTLIKLVLSLCQPTSGSVRRFGRPASDQRTLGRIGYVHESQAFPRYLTAEGLLTFYGALSLMPSETVHRRTPELLERVGLLDRRHEAIHRFSKGMIQRLGLAQALLNEPELLILDEPSEGLDLDGRRIVREVIDEYRRGGKTVILVSHLLAEVERLCDQAAVLVAGRLSFDGAIEALTGNGTRSLEEALDALYHREAA